MGPLDHKARLKSCSTPARATQRGSKGSDHPPTQAALARLSSPDPLRFPPTAQGALARPSTPDPLRSPSAAQGTLARLSTPNPSGSPPAASSPQQQSLFPWQPRAQPACVSSVPLCPASLRGDWVAPIARGPLSLCSPGGQPGTTAAPAASLSAAAENACTPTEQATDEAREQQVQESQGVWQAGG